MSKQPYWEVETPEIVNLGKNQLRIFKQTGKVQVFPIMTHAPNGVGRGATLDLDSMAIEELEELRTALNQCIDASAERAGA